MTQQYVNRMPCLHGNKQVHNSLTEASDICASHVRCILYSGEAYRSGAVKSFVRGRAMFNEECFGTWTMQPIASDTGKSVCEGVTFLQMFNDVGEVVMRLRSNEEGHKTISTLHSVGSNKIARIPHISRMWHEAILSLFRDISREVPVDLTAAADPVPVDLTAAVEATVGMSFDTCDGGDEDVECEVIDGGTHPGVVGGGSLC